MLVIWDSTTGAPMRNIFSAEKGGICSVDISSDGKFVVLLTAGEPPPHFPHDPTAQPQQVQVWEWGSDSDVPVATEKVPSSDVQAFVRFSLEDPTQFVSNGPQRVIFWRMDGQRLKFYSPPVSTKCHANPSHTDPF